MSWINQYSFTLLAGIVIVVFSAIIFRRGTGQPQIIALLALLLGFLLAYFFFNPGEGTSAGVERAQIAVGSGTPVLLEFQSPY